MPISNREIRVFYAIVAVWSIVCLLLTERVSYAFFKSGSVAYLVGVWLVLSLFPVVAVLWLWIMGRSPWDRRLLIPVAAMGVFFFIAANNLSGLYEKFDDVAFVAAFCSILAYLNAWLLKAFASVDALNWKRTKSVPAASVIIDHDKYLRLLSDKEISGFPSLIRVQQHFFEALPECIPALKDYGSIPNQDEMTEQLQHARKFMLGKISCQLAFLCAIAFYERMCGPDFKYTKQYQALVKRLLEIDAVAYHGPFDFEALNLSQEKLDLMKKAVTEKDLHATYQALEKQRENARHKNRQPKPDCDVTIVLIALTILVKEGLWQPESTSDFRANSKFTRMVKGGMNTIRETFS